MKRFMICAMLLLMVTVVNAQSLVTKRSYVHKSTQFGVQMKAGDEVELLDSAKTYKLLKDQGPMKNMSNVFALGATYFVQWNGVSSTVGVGAFVTSATKVSLYLPGTTATSVFVCDPLMATSATRPAAGDLLGWYARTDSLVITRAAGTTSGLTFSFQRIK